ncbi:hypothetical protein AZSI13_32450 [Azospira sp. I13]|uniref:N-acetylmuramoyl-L-alanine amidase n=1 Tax=Azospira sp. I13 TaxID=1765050 RepID=UPI000D458440|nr:N-acetylmuramoyl-L-alanine amidase [Azospira sp. I13]GBG03918.1 hypothetical protein AZSI13_32450 [Azospira sp. I13]
MRPIELLLIHCSQTPNGDDLFRASIGLPGFQTPVQGVDLAHKKLGIRRSSAWRERFNPDLAAIGHHYLIYRNGAIVAGRAEAEAGAHAPGFNQHSLSVCLIGTDQFTSAQWDSLKGLAIGLQAKYVGLQILGAGDLNPSPGPSPFNVGTWLSGRMLPLQGNLEVRQ